MSDMKKEKRVEIIQDALDYLDDDMLESVDKLRMGTKKTANKYSVRYLAVAASVCLLVIGAFAWENLIGPPSVHDAVLWGSESMDENEHAPEYAPGEPEQEGDMDYSTQEDIITDTKEEVDSYDDQETLTDAVIKPPVSGEVENPIEPEVGEPDHYPPIGDKYQLVNNYTKVTMLPNKVWLSEETIKENFERSREIGKEYYEKIDKFIEALCTTPLTETKMVMDAWMPEGDTDAYHLFFQRSDGEIVQVCIFSDYGCVYFYHDQKYCMKIEGDILYEVLKVLWTHW